MLLFHKVLLLYQLYILRIEPVHKDSFDCIRSKIDKIDNEIFKLLDTRALLSTYIYKYKIAASKKLQDKTRENAILNRLLKKKTTYLNKKMIRNIFTTIISECLKIQKTTQ